MYNKASVLRSILTAGLIAVTRQFGAMAITTRLAKPELANTSVLRSAIAEAIRSMAACAGAATKIGGLFPATALTATASADTSAAMASRKSGSLLAVIAAIP